MIRMQTGFYAVLAVVLLGATTSAHAIQHVVEYAVPRAGCRGTVVEIKLYGKYLENPKDVIFHRPGIKCLSVSTPECKGKGNLDFVEARFEIAPDCPIGEHLLRLRTEYYLAEPVTFWVTPFPVVNEAEKKQGENDTPDKAQKIELNSTVAGEIQSNESADRDAFTFVAKKGQRISVEALAARLATQHLNGENDVLFTVTDPAGQLIAKCDDSTLFVQDPCYSFVAAEEGTYIISITSQMYTRQSRLYYLLHIGTFSRPIGLYPLGGSPGEKLQLRGLGNPDGTYTETITLPEKPGDFDYFPAYGGVRAPTPMKLRVVALPNILETEPNDTLPQTRTITLPAALNGAIETENDTDLFRFQAEKGQSWRICVFARGLGMPLDPRVWIRAVKKDGELDDRTLYDLDDATMSERNVWASASRWQLMEMMDPSFVFKARDAGEYVLGITDSRGQSGPAYTYRIEITALRDGYHTYVVAERSEKRPRQLSFAIPQGNRWTMNISGSAIQGSEFKGDMELYAEGLPSGVSMTAPKLTRALQAQRGAAIPVLFTAAADVPLSAGFFRILARPTEGNVALETGCQQAFSYAERNQGYAWHHVIEDKFAYAVVAPTPFEIEVEQPSILARNGEIMLKTRIKRLNGWDGKVELQTDWTPPGVERGVAQILKPGETETVLRLRAGLKATLGTFQLVVTGSSTEGELLSGAGCRLATSPFISVTVAEPYVTATIKRSSIERGQKGTMVAELTHNTPMTGEANARLVGLPYGVKVSEPLPKISAEHKQVVFNLEASAEALVGQYKEIQCEIAITENGRTFKQQTGSGILRVDPARGSDAKQ